MPQQNGQPAAIDEFPPDVEWVRVEDSKTGHQYDVHRTAIKDGQSIVTGYEFNYGRDPRQPKHRVNKDGTAATQWQQPAEPTTTEPSGE